MTLYENNKEEPQVNVKRYAIPQWFPNIATGDFNDYESSIYSNDIAARLALNDVAYELYSLYENDKEIMMLINIIDNLALFLEGKETISIDDSLTRVFQETYKKMFQYWHVVISNLELNNN